MNLKPNRATEDATLRLNVLTFVRAGLSVELCVHSQVSSKNPPLRMLDFLNASTRFGSPADSPQYW